MNKGKIGIESYLFVFLFQLLTLFSCHQDEPVQIRVKNISNLNYDTVEVWSRSFGSVTAGNMTDYQTFDVAYAKAAVYIAIDTMEYYQVVIDYVGEDPLKGGRYSLLLDIINPNDVSGIRQQMIED